MRWIARFLENKSLWRLNRRSTARAVAIGTFCAMAPMPFQMPVAAVISVPASGNIPVAIVMCWISNPFTWAPLYYAAYKLGALLLGTPAGEFSFEPSVAWFSTTFTAIWPPLLLGCFLFGAVGALVGYYGTLLLWRMALVREWHRRRASRRLRAASKAERAA